MKIIRLSTFLDFGGVEKRLTNIAHIQDENQWIFCAINKGGTAENEIKKLNKKVIIFNLPYKIPNLITIFKLFLFFREERPNVVHTSGAEANFHGILAAKFARVPIIVSEEVGIPAQSKIAQSIFSAVYSFADFVVGNSNEVIQYLKTHNKVLNKKLIKIPNPVIFPALPESKKTEDGLFCIISVSRLEKVKNIDSTLRVIARLNEINLNVHYSIIGDGNEMNHLKKLTKELNIENKVTFLGFQENPYSFLLSKDLYVLTSFSEGFSNSLTEAMYCGLPSLTTRVGAAQEIIKHNQNGWIVNVNDDDDLMMTIQSIIKMDKGEQIAIGKKGRATIIQNYSLQNHIDLLMTMYKKK
jgi:glycosyltransferase involved in cell wall biosynthesis